MRQKPWHWHKAGTLPTISNVVVHDVSDTGFSVAFDVTPEAQGIIEYGATAAYGSFSDRSVAWATSHDITITGLSAGTYHYRVVADGHDGPNKSADATVEVAASNFPVISEIDEVNLTDTSVRIEWAVDPDATGQVHYGTTSGVYPYSTTFESSYLPAHGQNITGLSAGTQHFYYVESTGENGYTSQSAEGTFTTLGAGLTGGKYGSGVGATSLFNTHLGGPNGHNPHSFRFRAEQTANITAVRIYVIDENYPGYGDGTGGTVKFSLQADDGTGRPTGTDLYATTSVAASTMPDFPNTTLDTVWAVTTDTLYHVVMENTDSAPDENYISIDCLSDGAHYVPDTTPEDISWHQPKYDDGDFAFLFKGAGTTWYERLSHIPVLDITYSNGEHQGSGYMEVSHRGNSTIGVLNDTTHMVREKIIVSGGDKDVTGGGVRLSKASGSSGDLTVSLRNSSDVEIDSFTVAAASIPDDGGDDYGLTCDWVTGDFTATRTLSDATTYYLRFSTTSASTFYMWVVRSGVANYGFDEATVFDDGAAEYTTNGSTWGDLGKVPGQNNCHTYLDLA